MRMSIARRVGLRETIERVMRYGSPEAMHGSMLGRRSALILALLMACHAPATPAPSPPPPTPAHAPPAHTPPAEPPRRVPVVLVSIDGLRPDYVHRADEHGLGIPTLRAMVAQGAAATAVRGVLPTVTYPTHTTMVTGVSPTRHGVLANTTFDPFGDNHGGWYWYAEDVKVPTLWQLADEAGIPSASFYWPVNVGAKATWVLSQVWRADTDDDRKLTRATSTPGLVDELEANVGEVPRGRAWAVEQDEQRARAAGWFLEKHNPGLLTLHMLALDSAQHYDGLATPHVFRTLERLDGILGELREAARRSGGGRATMCVVSDHGFSRVDKIVNLMPELVRAGLVDARKREWSATLWAAGGTGAVVLRDPSDQAVLEKVRALLDRLAADKSLGIDRILRRDEIEALGGFGDASFVVAMRPGFYLANAWDGPAVRPAGPGFRGGHGYLPDDPEMAAMFVCEGEGVPVGSSLGAIDMRDVAPTLAGRLGITIPGAEGRDLFARPEAR